MASPAHGFSLDRGRIRLGNALLVYLERTFAPAEPLPPGVTPRPYGVAPTAIGSEGVVLAGLCEGEAVWLGFEPLDRSAQVELRVYAGGRSERLTCPPDHALPGLRGPEGYTPFTGGRLKVACTEPAVEVPVELLAAQDFKRMTGMSARPIDPDDAYGGERLP